MRGAILVSISELRKLLSYDGEAGKLRWLSPESKRFKPGDPAGWVNDRGYIRVTIKRKQYSAHRVAWAIHYGRWPTGIIDHADGNQANNAIANLREATGQLNQANQRTRTDNSSGYKGVTWCQRKRKWTSRIRANGKREYLGHFVDPADAHAAYVRRAVEVFGKFARAE